MRYNEPVKKYLDRHIAARYVAAGAGAILILAAGAAYAWYDERTEFVHQAEEFATARAAYEERISALDAQVAELQSRLDGEVTRNDEYDEQVRNLAYTVDKLEKLSKTDKELLAKYSNVYFLSENFVPSPLADIDDRFLARKGSGMQIHGNIEPKLKHMMEKAERDGAPLLVLSAYRSFGTQAGLKASYSVTYGKGTANQFSADQGYSEHQLASTVDFTSPDAPESLAAFESSPGFAWLTQHAHEYGFVLSYPKGNKFFTYEPWHWRYVGVDLATRLHVEGKNFYSLDQREINTYLVRIFD
jgi:LAS superfamily LD-carboxypeptidase LdcB